VALDPEVGVGYEELATGFQELELLEGISFNTPAAASTLLEWTPGHTLLLEKWQEAAVTGAPPIIQLTEQDINSLPQQDEAVALPPSLSVLFRIMGDKVYLEQAGGASATALAGRFSPLNTAIYQMTKGVAEQEESGNPNVIFAEIAHLCDEHTANIDRRSTVREYEIPVLVQSSHPPAQQVSLAELWVRVENGRIILWSERLQKEVVPRLGSAFNYMRDDLAVFRFLCDLQYQGLRSNFTLDLTLLFPNLGYYPRVEYKATVLHLATWHLPKERLQPLFQAAASEQAGLLRRLAKKLNWPRHIALTQNDHQLVFDLETDSDVAVFLQSVEKHTAPIMIREFPFLEEQKAAVTNEDGEPLIHQFMAALYHQQEVYTGFDLQRHPWQSIEQKRRLLPGSEWLYFKLYCHPSRSSSLLTTVVLPHIGNLQKAGRVRQWFFVRYRDPDYHLRVRLQLAPEDAGTVLAAVSGKLSKFVEKGIVSDFTVAVYDRELERYGTGLVEATEDVFCASSALLAECMSQSLLDTTAHGVYRIACSGISDIFHAFGLSLQEKANLLRQLYESFYEEFGQTKALKPQLSRKYRAISKGGDFPSKGPMPGNARLQKLHRNHIASLQAIARKAKRLRPGKKKQLVADLLHMHLNRLFIDEARKQELVVYYSLWRAATSALARSTS